MSDGAPTSSPASAGVESPAHARNAASDEIGSVFIFAEHYFFGYLNLGAVGGDRYLKRTQVDTWVTGNPFPLSGPPTPGGETRTTVTHVSITGVTTTDPVVYDPDQATFDHAGERAPLGATVYTLISPYQEKTEYHLTDAASSIEFTVEVTLDEVTTHDEGAAACLELLLTPDIDSYETNTFVTVDDVDRPVTIETSDFTNFYDPEGIRGQAFYRFVIGVEPANFTHFQMQRSKTVSPLDPGVKIITGATNTTPIIITTATDHNFSDGDRVTISGVVGNEDANGEWNIDNVTDNSFELLTSVGSGAYSAGGEVIDLEYRICIVTVKNSETDSTKCIPFAVLQEEEAIYLEPACHRGLDFWDTTLYRGSNDYPDSCMDSDTSGADPDCSLS